MAAPQGLFRFPGVAQVISGNFTFSHGISPSSANVEIAPQEDLITTNGTLTVEFGQVTIDFPGCRVSAPSVRHGIDGRVLSFQIEDRRWRWAYGEIYGRYNLKKADGTIDKLNSEEKTPQQLATLLLRAMGEGGFDVSALPSKTWRPTCEWDGDNPAEELANLCDLLGCRICLGIDNKVRIVKLGSGEELPTGGTRRTAAYGLQITGIPDSLKVVCSSHKFQGKLKLQAVGKDTDGRIKPIAQLSYTPTDPTTGVKGWTNQYPDLFSSITNKAARRLALQTVWRWYRIVSQADGSLNPPGWPAKAPPVTDYRQYLPISGQLLQTQLDLGFDPQDLQIAHSIPAFVEGAFAKRDYTYGRSTLYNDVQQGVSTDPTTGNVAVGTRYVGTFSLDEERGIVMFGDVVSARQNGSGYYEPDLYLTCAYSCENDKNLPLRYAFERQLVSGSQRQGTGPRVIPAPDIRLEVIAKYGPDGKKVESISDNQKTVDGWCKEILDAAQAQYQVPATEEVEWAGFMPIQLDGRIQQVAWYFGGTGGAKTKASSNTEFDLAVPDYKTLRAQQRSQWIQARTYRDIIVKGAK